MDFDLEAAHFAPESIPSFALAPAFVLLVTTSETGCRVSFGDGAGGQFVHLLDDRSHLPVVIRGFRRRHRGAPFDGALDDRLASLDQPHHAALSFRLWFGFVQAALEGSFSLAVLAHE